MHSMAQPLKISESLSSAAVPDQFFYGHGKLLLTAEYLVLEGAKALAVPCLFGQSLSVKYTHSFNPKLTWRSYLQDGTLWFETFFEFWRFNILDHEGQVLANPSDEALFIQKLLRQVRKQNVHFLRDELDVVAESKINFPLPWGLGSSSSLIHNLAQWGATGAYELLFKTLGGSGYDVACAQADGPILYEKKGATPHWRHVLFSPPFAEQLYFLYLGKKQCSKEAIKQFKEMSIDKKLLHHSIKAINQVTDEMFNCKDLDQFERLLAQHEMVMAEVLMTAPLKKKDFPEFWGEMKSLGAWGGDFALVTSRRSFQETKDFFAARGLKELIPFNQMILPQSDKEWRYGHLH